MILSLIASCAGVAGCARSNSLVGASPVPVPPVQVAKDCAELARPVPEPVWSKAKTRRTLLAETTVALIEANDTLKASARCQDKLYETLGRPTTRW